MVLEKTLDAWNQKLFLLLLTAMLALVALSNGCYSRTRITGQGFFPPGGNSDTAEYIVGIVSDGAIGKAYSDYSSKEVTVALKNARTGKIEFSRKYAITAGNLNWKFTWPEKGDLWIEFYDRDKPDEKNHVKTVHLILAPHFIEAE